VLESSANVRNPLPDFAPLHRCHGAAIRAVESVLVFRHFHDYTIDSVLRRRMGIIESMHAQRTCPLGKADESIWI